MLGALQTSGKVTLQRARIPLGWSGDALTGVDGTMSLIFTSIGSQEVSHERFSEFPRIRHGGKSIERIIRLKASTR